jgi:hypothetical protein
MAGEDVAEETATYGGFLGAFPYAFRASGSRLFRSYVVVGGLLAILLVLFFAFGVIVSVQNTLGAVGGTFTFARSFVLFVGFLVLLPVVAPILLVARRHRRGVASSRYDRALAASGYLFVPALYLLLLITAPPGLRDPPAGPLAPVVELLYALPPAAGVLPPLLAVAATYAVHRRYRPAES